MTLMLFPTNNPSFRRAELKFQQDCIKFGYFRAISTKNVLNHFWQKIQDGKNAKIQISQIKLFDVLGTHAWPCGSQICAIKLKYGKKVEFLNSIGWFTSKMVILGWTRLILHLLHYNCHKSGKSLWIDPNFAVHVLR